MHEFVSIEVCRLKNCRYVIYGEPLWLIPILGQFKEYVTLFNLDPLPPWVTWSDIYHFPNYNFFWVITTLMCKIIGQKKSKNCHVTFWLTTSFPLVLFSDTFTTSPLKCHVLFDWPLCNIFLLGLIHTRNFAAQYCNK